MTISDILQQIKSFCFQEAPFYKQLTFVSFTKQEIKDLQRTLGFELHEQLVEFLTTCDFRLDLDGAFSYENKDFFQHRCLLGRELAREMEGVFKQKRQDMAQSCFLNWEDGSLAPYYYHQKWLAIAEDGCGNQICIDHIPGENGIYGQVLQMEFQDSQGPFFIKSSLQEYLEFQLHCLQNGQWETWEYGEEGNPELIGIDSFLKLNRKR